MQADGFDSARTLAANRTKAVTQYSANARFLIFMIAASYEGTLPGARGRPPLPSDSAFVNSSLIGLAFKFGDYLGA